MKLWKWQPGRQDNVTYKKFPLWSFRIGRFGFDGYILRYEWNTKLPPHRDPVTNGKHWRINISLSGSSMFYCEDRGYSTSWINVFRPDLYIHSLHTASKVFKLSFGFVKFNK
jgi:hypothetical protein